MPGSPLSEISKRSVSRGLAGLLWPRRGPLSVRLERYGDPAAIAGRIDAELTAAGVDGRSGEIWLTSSWIVALDGPAAVRLAELAALGIGAGTAGRWRVVCWEQDATAPHTFEVGPAEGERIREQARHALPDLLVADVEAFAARWEADRLVCDAAALACGTRAHPPAA